jgi:hypothetical protein
MPDIKDSVGEGGLNRRHEVALIQVLLKAVKDVKGHAYFNHGYNGSYAADLKNAIIKFQVDKKLVTLKKTTLTGLVWPFNPPSKVSLSPFKWDTEKAGFIDSNSKTMKELSAALPLDYKTIAILENIGLAYWETAAADANASAAAVQGNGTLEPGFRANVASLINQMHTAHKLTLAVVPRTGGLRTFQEQYIMATKPNSQGKIATKAGPGESNHNYGNAVDLGFAPFKWLNTNGQIVNDDHSLQTLEKTFNPKFVAMWALRNALATPLGLYKTNLKDDYGHLQNFNDFKLSMGRSLAALMSLVGKHKWKFVGSGYQCDLGLGGAFYGVGTSEQIWAGKAPVAAKDLTQALTAAKKVAKVTPADVNAMQVKLQSDIKAADNQRFKWVPLP